MIRKVCRPIEEIEDETSPSLDRLNAEFEISRSHLQRTFKAAAGISPREYAQSRRVNKFKTNVKNAGNVTTAIYNAGFNSSSRLYEKAADEFELTPATYFRGAAGISIACTIAESSPGRTLVAATEKGICAVSLGDGAAELEQSLFREFPYAGIDRDDSGLKKFVEKF